jgi:tripartite-type tricarboxylate transporter receptor subunit TctC
VREKIEALEHHADVLAPPVENLLRQRPEGATRVESSHRLAVDYAKKNPGKLNAGGPASGGMMNLIVLETAKGAGIDVTYVPFAGGGPSGTALLGGHIQYRVAQPTEVFPNVRAGKTRGIAVGFPTRIPEMPDVPTFRELGIPFDVPVFGFDLWGPPNLPAPIASQLTRAFEQAVKDPGYVDTAKKLTYQPVFVGPEPLKQMMRQFDKEIGPKLVAAFPPEAKK